MPTRARAPAPSPAPLPAVSGDLSRDALGRLSDEEDRLRKAADLEAPLPAERTTGANPIDLTATGDGRFVALLSGMDAIVLLDAHGTELQRLPTLAYPTALAVMPDATVVVAAWGSAVAARYHVGKGGLEPLAALEVGDARSIVDLAASGEGVLYAADAASDRFLAIPLGGGAPRELWRCAGPHRVVRRDTLLALDCALAHEVHVFSVDPHGHTRPLGPPVHHDGPIWSLDLLADGPAAFLALGGVEDHPLDRRRGGFDHVDSFLFLYRIATDVPAERLAALDASEAGVVTPKWLRLEAHGDELRVDAIGFATDRRLTVAFDRQGRELRRASATLLPGIVAVAATPDGELAVSTLLDVVVTMGKRGVTTHAIADAPMPPASARVGELLFFTTLMSPWVGRVTCETCHLDGYGDGRVHFTGRDDVHATTRPLRGALLNRPYFSRALDRNAATMVHAEFRVANAGGGRSSWFALDAGMVPWLRHVPDLPASFDPLALRIALLQFLAGFGHEPNPLAVSRTKLDAGEQRGAELFRDRCEGCHQARLVADEVGTRVPFARWTPLILSPTAPIIWGSELRARTGVTPYVHAEGPRTPSLRRLYRKRPYFTDGSAADLPQLLWLARSGDDGAFAHDLADDADAAQAMRAFSDDDRSALLAFLRLL